MPDIVAPLLVSAFLLACLAGATAVVLRRRRRGQHSPDRRTDRRPAPAPHAVRKPPVSPRPATDPAREQRTLEQLGIRPLATGARERYLLAWEGVQTRLRDRPVLALSAADSIVERLLRERGFPVDDPRAATDVLPGRQAQMLQNFRAGHALEQVNTSTRSDPGQVQQGMQHFDRAFRALLDDSMEIQLSEPAGARREPGRS